MKLDGLQKKVAALLGDGHEIMVIRLHFVVTLLIAMLVCGCDKKAADGALDRSDVATTNLSSNQLGTKLVDEPPDILSATNLHQWKSLIKDLKQERMLENHWVTARFRTGTLPVLLKHNDQSIIYKALAIDVTTIHGTTDLLEAQIYSPKMNIDETRAMGLKLCSMFGFDSKEFLTWCDSVGNNWLDAPLFVTRNSTVSTGDQWYQLSVRRAYNDKQPWCFIFSVNQKSALSKLMGESSK